jgi:hypothetical protein
MGYYPMALPAVWPIPRLLPRHWGKRWSEGPSTSPGKCSTFNPKNFVNPRHAWTYSADAEDAWILRAEERKGKVREGEAGSNWGKVEGPRFSESS